MALSAAQLAELSAVEDELRVASTWLGGPRGAKFVRLADRVAAIAGLDEPAAAEEPAPSA